MASIIVERKSDNELEKQEWRFYIVSSLGSDANIYLVLDDYHHATRPTKRHGWQKDDFYNRLNMRQSKIKCAALVPLPEGVVAEAKNRINAVVTLEYPK